MIHEILPVGMLQCNCSIYGDERSGEAIVIDPGDDVQEIMARVGRHNLRVKAIVITHAHIDHIGGAGKLKAKTGAPVYMNAKDQFIYDDIANYAAWLGMRPPASTSIDTYIKDGDTLNAGPAELIVLDTPGHTPGSISLWIPSENKLIAGDTLFREGIGRTDLPGGDGRQIIESIRGRLFTLPEDAMVIPGHGPNTTIAREKAFNPFLQ